MSETLCLHASSETDADFLYATGFHVPDPVFWFRKGWRSYLVVSPLELGRAREQARVHHVINFARERERVAREGGRAPAYADVIAAILKGRNVGRVTVNERFPLLTADTLRRRGIRVKVRRGSFFPERVSKRPDEVDAIRHVQEANERALDAALAVLREARVRRGYLYHDGGRVTSESLRSVISASLLVEECIASHTIVVSGDQCVDPHNVGTGPIRANQSLILDIFPRHAPTGYYADMTRTVVRGRPSKQLREIYALVESAQQYAFERIHGGADGQAIHRGIQRLFDDAGWATGPRNGGMQGFFHGTGHGVGLDIHEPPSFGNRPDTLPAGAVVTVEPGLYYPRIGGVRLEDMVVVTRDGCENLTRYPKQLEL